MDAYALVLNAGSSSLKFCVFRRPDAGRWELAAHGQVDGIGSTPKLAARDGAGISLVERALEPAVRDGKAALEVLARWLREKWGGAQVLGVGHRVVHGGARYSSPCIVTPEVCDDQTLCTIDHCDPWFGCYFIPVDGDDNNQCTIDLCDPESGIQHVPGYEGEPCEDGLSCSTGGTWWSRATSTSVTTSSRACCCARWAARRRAGCGSPGTTPNSSAAASPGSRRWPRPGC